MDEELLEKLEKQKKLTLLVNIVVILVYLYMVLSMFTTLTGLSLSQLFHRIQHRKLLPPNWVEKYSFELYTMQWIVFFLILIDLPVAMYFRDEEGAVRAPKAYVMALSFVYTVFGIILYSAYGYPFDLLLFVFGILSIFRSIRELPEKKEEVETDLFEDASEASVGNH